PQATKRGQHQSDSTDSAAYFQYFVLRANRDQLQQVVKALHSGTTEFTLTLHSRRRFCSLLGGRRESVPDLRILPAVEMIQGRPARLFESPCRISPNVRRDNQDCGCCQRYRPTEVGRYSDGHREPASEGRGHRQPAMSPDEERSRRQYMPVRFRHGCALIDLGSCLGLSSLVKGQSLGAKSPTEPASP